MSLIVLSRTSNCLITTVAMQGETISDVTSFLERKLKLKVNGDKSAVARPWERKFLGYSMTHHMSPRLKIAEASVRRLREKLKEAFHRGQGRNLGMFVEQELNPVLRGCDQVGLISLLDLMRRAQRAT